MSEVKFQEITISDLLKLDLVRKNVLIIGSPRSGKSWITNLMEKKFQYHRIIHTDKYQDGSNYEESLYDLIKDLDDDSYKIIEGVLGYRLLRKSVEDNSSFKPDVVVKVMTTENNIKAGYKGKESTFKNVLSMIKGNDTVLKSYFKRLGMNKPKFYVVVNEYEIEKLKKNKEK